MPTHSDRGEIEPGSSDMERLMVEGVQFTRRVTDELLRRKIGDAAQTPDGGKPSETGSGESPEWPPSCNASPSQKEKAEESLFEQPRVKDWKLEAKD